MIIKILSAIIGVALTAAFLIFLADIILLGIKSFFEKKEKKNK